MDFNLDALHAATLRLVDREAVSLVLVGCGGTGSWLAPAIVRTARLLIEKFHKTVQIVFVDPDAVEPKNCYRQNFAEFETGQNKAVTLAQRYGLAWGLDVLALPAPFDAKLDDVLSKSRDTFYSLTVVIGCVDNAKARAEIARYMTAAPYGSARWWLDCGNSGHSGQVLLGGFNNPDDKTGFPIPNYCTRLPLPTEQHPELLDDSGIEAEDEAGISCADLALRGEQGLAVNQQVAAIAADFLLQMLVYGTLTRFQTYFDQGSGAMRSTPITPQNLKGHDLVAKPRDQLAVQRDDDIFGPDWEDGGDDHEVADDEENGTAQAREGEDAWLEAAYEDRFSLSD
jgi:PRTRC genetic system ThiF family protein